MSVSVLSTAQFSKRSDPKPDPKASRVRFSGGHGSKTMSISRGHVPKPPGEHPHHRKAGKRTRRAR